MKKFTKRTWVLFGVVAVAAVAAVGGYAYFTSTGTGNGTATVGTSANLVVAQDAFGTLGSGPGPDAVLLYPGSGVQAVTGTVTNTASFSQSFNTIVATIQAPTGANVGGTPPCTAADFDLTSSAGWVISGGGSTATLSGMQTLAASGVYAFSGLNVVMVENNLNQDSCKNATVHIQYVASQV